MITLEQPASGVPLISHAQLLERAREQWSEAEIAEALGVDAPRVLSAAQRPPLAGSYIHDAVRSAPAPALQLVASAPAGPVADGTLRPQVRGPLPSRRRVPRKPAPAPAPPLPPARRRRADGVREATLSYFEIRYHDLVPVLRLRGRWLDQHGFKIGARIYIAADEGKLVITATDPAAAHQPARVPAPAVAVRAAV